MSGPSTAFVGGRVLVGDDDALRSADLLVRDGCIEAIASPGGIRTADEFVDLDGAAVLPGFIDGHCHLELTVQAIEYQIALHTPGYRSIAEMLATIQNARAVQPEGWIVGRSSFGFQDDVAEKRLPHRSELDAVSPGQPLVILAGLHVACLNSAAMSALGVDDTAELPDWITRHRDDRGSTGVFTEVWDRLPTHSVVETVAALRTHALRLFSSKGTTSLSTIPTSADDVRALHRLAQADELPFRVRFYTHVPRTADLDDVLAWGPESGFGDDRLRFGGIKIFVDGEGGDGLGRPRDDTKRTAAELATFVDRADAAGIQLMMHAVTPHGIWMACTAVIAARQHRPPRVRHRIEHGADNLDLADLPLIARAGVRLVATPHFVRSSGFDDGRFQPLRSLIEAGHHVIGGTDSTGTAPGTTGALTNIALAAGRRGSRGEPSPERIDVRNGVRMFTTWSAEGAGEEHEKGRIAANMLADLVVLDEDPFSIDLERLDEVEILLTVVGGRIVAGSRA